MLATFIADFCAQNKAGVSGALDFADILIQAGTQ